MTIQRLILLALGLAIISCAHKTEKSIVEQIDCFLSNYEKLNKLSGTVLVSKNSRILLNKGYGYRNAERKIANDSNSIFQIYSITKTFTSTMILKLIEDKKLSLYDPLSKFYPGFPNGNNITIEHLLTHTSGINDDVDTAGILQTEEFRISAFGKNKPSFAPGEAWSYSNAGYQLLGYIIQKVTGLSYEQAIRQYIFYPLEMKGSGFNFKGLSLPEKAVGYNIYTNSRHKEAEIYDSIIPFSAGSIYSTAGDMYKYYKSFASHKILNAASQAIAFEPVKSNKTYGHGWQLKKYFFKPDMFFHGGGAAGFRTIFAMVPEENICVIILNNNENAAPEYLALSIIDILNNKTVELPQEVMLGGNQLEKVTGAYSVQGPHPMLLYTSVVDGRLAVAVAGQGKTTVIAKDDSTFIQSEEYAEIKFMKDDKGVYSNMQIKQRGNIMEGTKIESAWGLIGDATIKGWADSLPDIKLTEDKERKGLWHLKNIALNNGQIKFRLNNDWNINYGDNNADMTLELHGKNITVEAGTYDILLNMTDEVLPRLSLLKKGN